MAKLMKCSVVYEGCQFFAFFYDFEEIDNFIDECRECNGEVTIDILGFVGIEEILVDNDITNDAEMYELAAMCVYSEEERKGKKFTELEEMLKADGFVPL